MNADHIAAGQKTKKSAACQTTLEQSAADHKIKHPVAGQIKSWHKAVGQTSKQSFAYQAKTEQPEAIQIRVEHKHQLLKQQLSKQWPVKQER